MKQKLTSRKFWLATAAFLGSFGCGIAGIATGDGPLAIVGLLCSTLSASIYAAIEAAVDLNRGF